MTNTMIDTITKTNTEKSSALLNNGENIRDILNVKYEGKPCYDIVFANDFSLLSSKLQEFNIEHRKVMIVTESNVGPIYADAILNSLKQVCPFVEIFEFKAGEASKNLDIVSELYERLIIKKFDRNDLLIALGGGVVGDLTGFTAATYLRGIDFVQIPTSLLSQVDSSIGGKTGVDFKSYKNMVGAFYQPKLVYINISALNSLPYREYVSGMAEILKHGLIIDEEYFYWLIKNRELILNRDLETLKKMIYISCDIKRGVVERDPKEKGERALLNLGHTIGHAVEKLKDFSLLHGECVAIGICSAAYISMKKSLISKEDYDTILNGIKAFDLPVMTDNLIVNEVVEATLNDKKMQAGVIKFVLLASIGDAVVDTTVTMDEMSEATDIMIEK